MNHQYIQIFPKTETEVAALRAELRRLNIAFTEYQPPPPLPVFKVAASAEAALREAGIIILGEWRAV